MKRAMRKAHNVVLWTITYTMFVLAILAAMVTEFHIIPAIVLFVSLGWLAVFANVNKGRWN